MTKRTDIHRPAEFNPADYRVIDYLDNKRPEFPIWAAGSEKAHALYLKAVERWQERIFEHFPDWRTAGVDHTSIHQCNHCGHPGIRWVAVVEHVPTGGKLAFGEICADRVEIPGRDAFRAKFVKTQAEREEAAFEKQLRELQFRIENLEITDWLDSLSSDYDADTHPFLLDMKAALKKYGELTERQLAAVAKFKAGADKLAARKAEQAEEMKDVPALREGRYEIEGEIVSTKWQDSHYGGALKMLVRLDDGNKVWGTVPESLFEARNIRDAEGHITEQRELKGLRVSFIAAVARSDNDKNFGFFKRPAKAVVVEVVA